MKKTQGRWVGVKNNTDNEGDNKNKAMINKTNIMHFQALLLQIVAVIITYTSGLEQVQYTVKLFSMEKIKKQNVTHLVDSVTHTFYIAVSVISGLKALQLLL